MRTIENLINTFFELVEGLKIESEDLYIIIMSVCSIKANLSYEVSERGETSVINEIQSYINIVK